jgi:hypothetical protein
LIISSAGSN